MVKKKFKNTNKKTNGYTKQDLYNRMTTQEKNRYNKTVSYRNAFDNYVSSLSKKEIKSEILKHEKNGSFTVLMNNRKNAKTMTTKERRSKKEKENFIKQKTKKDLVVTTKDKKQIVGTTLKNNMFRDTDALGTVNYKSEFEMVKYLKGKEEFENKKFKSKMKRVGYKKVMKEYMSNSRRIDVDYEKKVLTDKLTKEMKKGGNKKLVKKYENEITSLGINIRAREMSAFGNALKKIEKDEEDKFGKGNSPTKKMYRELSKRISYDLTAFVGLKTDSIKGINSDGTIVFHDSPHFGQMTDMDDFIIRSNRNIGEMDRHILAITELIWNKGMDYERAMEFYFSRMDFSKGSSYFMNTSIWS